MNDPWHTDQNNIVALATWLVEDSGYDAPQLLEFLRKPWHWDSEWEIYQRELSEVEL